MPPTPPSNVPITCPGGRAEPSKRSLLVPELPEVETARRLLEEKLAGRQILAVDVRCRQLRWPVDSEIADRLPGSRLAAIRRRAKYLILETDRGAAISHLGMSGRWRVVPWDHPLEKHDHVDVSFEGGVVARYHDPRRFGALLWGGAAPLAHVRLAEIGPEPWGGPAVAEIAEHLWRAARGRKIPLRDFLLDGRVIAGVGNIYASEAAFGAGIRPTIAAGRISRLRYGALADSLRTVLETSIERGGTTLRDFSDPEGNAGRYGERCAVYGRAGETCDRCKGVIRRRVHQARSLFYCPGCQK